MAKAAPAFQFYAQDFYMGTSDLSAAARGCYISMLCMSWTAGPIADNLNSIAKAMSWGPMDPPFADLWAEIKGKWTLGPDGWTNERLEEIRANQEKHRQIQAQRGKVGGKASAQARAVAESQAVAEAEPQAQVESQPQPQVELQPQPEPSSLISDLRSSSSSSASANKKRPRGKRADPVPLEGFDEFWLAYPLKVKKLDAIAAWNDIAPSRELREFIGAALIWQKPRLTFEQDGEIRGTYPASWLRAKRWTDERPATTGAKPKLAVADVKRLAHALGPHSWAAECMSAHGGTCGSIENHDAQMAVAS